MVQSMKLLPTLLLAASSLTASAQVSFGNPYKFNDDWQFSLFEFSEVSKGKFEQIEGSLVYNRKD